jgi:hypothetical protein
VNVQKYLTNKDIRWEEIKISRPHHQSLSYLLYSGTVQRIWNLIASVRPLESITQLHSIYRPYPICVNNKVWDVTHLAQPVRINRIGILYCLREPG